MGTLITRGAGNALTGLDVASRVKLDDMWFRDSRKNQDEVEALQTFLVDLLGPTAGLLVNVAEARKLWNEGHGDRALVMIAPAFIKSPLVAARYATEGVNTMSGDPLMEDVSPFHLMAQSLGLRSADLSEIQFYNTNIKGQEQAILKQRQNLLNLYALAFMIILLAHSETKWDRFLYRYKVLHPLAWIIERTISTPSTHFAHHGLTAEDGISHPNGNFGNLLFFWDILFGTAKITRKYPETFGAWNQIKEPWYIQLLFPIFRSKDSRSELHAWRTKQDYDPSVDFKKFNR
jgi:hypothetical protein